MLAVAAVILTLACDGGDLADRLAQGGSDGAPGGGVLISTPAPTVEPAEARDPNLLLPDLTTTEPEELYLEETADGREIRLSTTILNAGEGPIRILGNYGPDRLSATAVQEIERRGDAPPLQRYAGVLLHHPLHRHWHLERFAVFELWKHDASGRLTDMVTSSDKISFCLIDQFPPEPDLPDSPPAEFTDCDWQYQGITPGWSETYDATLPGQALDITTLPDGNYALRTVIDPDHLLLESNATNNTYVTYITISGDEVTIRPAP